MHPGRDMSMVLLIMPDPTPPSIHRIRLKGPWEWAVPTASPAVAWIWSRIRLPDEWARLPEQAGPVWFRRRFHTPTGITPTDRVRLAIPTTHRQVAVNLNGHSLVAISLANPEPEAIVRFEISGHLADRNLLEIILEGGVSPTNVDGGLGHPVVLEIEPA